MSRKITLANIQTSKKICNGICLYIARNRSKIIAHFQHLSVQKLWFTVKNFKLLLKTSLKMLKSPNPSLKIRLKGLFCAAFRSFSRTADGEKLFPFTGRFLLTKARRNDRLVTVLMW